ncbi:hypothetical protein O6H91_06G020400 [Diphasiastrum complanatum]|uniref:Uncharacterized protein n=1 Tax=Diphasiastrum complanatum TaxID=34168 RepID=A0ACC2DBF2_DIPCM|nr:hypothetical protein O6H91_06G020400 [Diphasiastrum complanatum]
MFLVATLPIAAPLVLIMHSNFLKPMRWVHYTCKHFIWVYRKLAQIWRVETYTFNFHILHSFSIRCL